MEALGRLRCFPSDPLRLLAALESWRARLPGRVLVAVDFLSDRVVGRGRVSPSDPFPPSSDSGDLP